MPNSNYNEARNVGKPTTTERPLTMSSMSETKCGTTSSPDQGRTLPHWTGPHEIVDKSFIAPPPCLLRNDLCSQTLLGSSYLKKNKTASTESPDRLMPKFMI